MNLASKLDNVNKVSKQWLDQMSSVIEDKFLIMGEKSGEWNQNMKDSFMDQSVEINADNIM